MTSALHNFEILWKDNKWNFISPEQKEIITLAAIVKKLRDDNIKVSKSFNTYLPGKDKGKRKGEVKKPAGK